MLLSQVGIYQLILWPRTACLAHAMDTTETAGARVPLMVAVDAEYSTSHDFVGSNNPSPPNFGGKEKSERNSSFGGAWPVRGGMK